MLRQIIIIVGSLATTLLASVVVAAEEDGGFYVGVGGGQARNESEDVRLDSTLLRALVGYSFNRYFATEVAYVDPAEASDTIDGARLELDTRGVVAALIASAPLTDRWSLFGKLGWAFYDVDQTIRINNASFPGSESDDDLVYGVGTRVRLGERFTLRLEYEAVDVPDGDFESVTLSGVFQF